MFRKFAEQEKQIWKSGQPLRLSAEERKQCFEASDDIEICIVLCVTLPVTYRYLASLLLLFSFSRMSFLSILHDRLHQSLLILQQHL